MVWEGLAPDLCSVSPLGTRGLRIWAKMGHSHRLAAAGGGCFLSSPHPLDTPEQTGLTVRSREVVRAHTKLWRDQWRKKPPSTTLTNAWVAYSEGTSEGAPLALPKSPLECWVGLKLSSCGSPRTESLPGVELVKLATRFENLLKATGIPR